ncbi:MAG: rubrerythrin family protein [Calditrichaeota bacterium]|nr:MAG: rubrerythrin family protein [Calditrichota bacterium]
MQKLFTFRFIRDAILLNKNLYLMQNMDKKRIDLWKENWKKEVEGEYLYRQLAQLVDEPNRRHAYEEMAEMERRHAEIWAKHLQEQGVQVPEHPKPSVRTRLLAWIARRFGPMAINDLLASEEVRDMGDYHEQARTNTSETLQKVIADEATHARALQSLKSGKKVKVGEPEIWHRGARAGGLLRDIVYGFNDGLTANFGLVMGVVGADTSREILLLAGWAGTLADALSMASSGFLAAKSEQEVRQHHLELEQMELEMMPEEEEHELKLMYQAKGLDAETAGLVAKKLMEDPDVALAQLAREELGLDPETPPDALQEGVTTGIATAIGAAIPIFPFMFWEGQVAIWVSIALSMFAHFAVGASRALFTGRPAFRSGFEMFLVGMGVALFTFLLGKLFGVAL